jgi:hypothetical protein
VVHRYNIKVTKRAAKDSGLVTELDIGRIEQGTPVTTRVLDGSYKAWDLEWSKSGDRQVAIKQPHALRRALGAEAGKWLVFYTDTMGTKRIAATEQLPHGYTS